MVTVRRIASVIELNPGAAEEYERLHAEVWPEVLDTITRCNMKNYSIYRYGSLLVSYFEYDGRDFEADMQVMAEDPTTQRWWALCNPLQDPVKSVRPGEWWHEIPEIFHHD